MMIEFLSGFTLDSTVTLSKRGVEAIANCVGRRGLFAGLATSIRSTFEPPSVVNSQSFATGTSQEYEKAVSNQRAPAARAESCSASV